MRVSMMLHYKAIYEAVCEARYINREPHREPHRQIGSLNKAPYLSVRLSMRLYIYIAH